MRWMVLPGSLDPEARRLVVRMRRLKDHKGLSPKSLEARTAFSSWSWQRYLNGKALPPKEAVEALAELTGEDRAPLLVALDAAERARAGAAPSAGGIPRRGCEREPDVPEVWVAALSAAVGALLMSAVTAILLVADPWSRQGSTQAQGGVTGVGKYTCAYTRRGDQMFAGNSSTTTRLVALNNTGQDAAEIQCLLLRHRLSPGDVDGYYGRRTEAAVKQLQQLSHVPADGIVDEQDWAVLRHVG